MKLTKLLKEHYLTEAEDVLIMNELSKLFTSTTGYKPKYNVEKNSYAEGRTWICVTYNLGVQCVYLHIVINKSVLDWVAISFKDYNQTIWSKDYNTTYGKKVRNQRDIMMKFYLKAIEVIRKLTPNSTRESGSVSTGIQRYLGENPFDKNNDAITKSIERNYRKVTAQKERESIAQSKADWEKTKKEIAKWEAKYGRECDDAFVILGWVDADGNPL